MIGSKNKNYTTEEAGNNGMKVKCLPTQTRYRGVKEKLKVEDHKIVTSDTANFNVVHFHAGSSNVTIINRSYVRNRCKARVRCRIIAVFLPE